MVRILSLLILCCGCSVAEHYEDGRLVSRSVGFGVVLEAPCLKGGERNRMKIFGLSISDREAVLGYLASDRICLPLGSCGTIFFVNTDGQISAINQLFPDLPSACIIRNYPSTGNKEEARP
jgi:hypothetical protein